MKTFEIKAELLNNSICIKLNNKSEDILSAYINNENHHHNEWVFFKTKDDVRIRMTISSESIYTLENIEGKLYIFKNNTKLLEDVIIEKPIIHAPDQLFLGLYEYCKIGCSFCPLSKTKDNVHYSLDSIYNDIESHLQEKILSVGITTSIPYHLELSDLEDELIFVVKKIRKKLPNIPMGLSTKTPSINFMETIKNEGVSEIRLNMELYNRDLAKKIMPKKNIDEIKESLLNAVKIFGKGKVSCNFIVGIGETDNDLELGVEWCCKNGIIPTLYPYDPIDLTENQFEMKIFEKPSKERLIKLAIMHKNYLMKYDLFKNTFETMCLGCSASHINPIKDMVN